MAATDLEPIIAKYIAEVDTKSFDAGVKYARDTKKKLDAEMLVKMQLDVLTLEKQIATAKASIKTATGTEKIKLELDLQTYKSQLTEAKRQLQNYRNTGEAELSRLQAKFNMIWDKISGIWKWTSFEWLFSGVWATVQKAGAGIDGLVSKISSIPWASLLAAWWLAVVWWQAVSFFTDASKAARDFEQGLARINTVARLSEDGLSRLSNQIKSVSAEYGIAKNVLLDAWFSIASAWVDAQNIWPILELSAKAAVASWEDINTNFQGISAVIKWYWLELSKSTEVADLFFKANEVWSTTVGQMAGAIQWVTPTANAAWLSLNELFAVYGTLTGVTGNASEVTTQLERALKSVIAPSTESRNIMDSLWIQFDQNTIRTKWLGWAMKELYDKTQGNPELLRKVLWSSEALNLVLALWWPQAQKYAENIDKMSKSAWSLDTAVTIMADTTETKIQKWIQARDNFKISIWNTVNIWISYIADFINAFSNIPQYIWIYMAEWLASILLFVAKVNDYFYQLGASFAKFRMNIWSNFKIAWNNLAVYFLQWINGLWSGVINILNWVLKGIEWLVNWWIKWINKLIAWVNNIPWVNIKALGEINIWNISIKSNSAQIWQLQAYNAVLKQTIEANNQLVPAVNKTSLALQNQAFKIQASAKISSSKIWKTKTTADIQKEIVDSWVTQNQKLPWDNPLWDDKKDKKWWWKSADQKAKDEIEAKKKQLEAQAKLEIEAVKKSTATELDKANKIAEINKKLTEDKKKLDDEKNKSSANSVQAEADNAKKIQDQYKKLQDTGVKAYTEIEQKQIESVDKMIWFEKQIDAQIAKYKSLKDEASKALQDINNSLDQNKIAQTNSLLDRSVAIQKEIKDLQKSNQDQNTSFEELTANNVKIASLMKEQELISNNTTESQRQQRQELEKMTEAEKILKKSAEERLALEEKARIIKSFQSGTLEDPTIQISTGKDWQLEAKYKDETWNMVAITDFKNAQYAQDLLNKQLTIQQDLQAVQDQKDKEALILKGFNDSKIALDKQYTAIFKQQIAAQVAATQTLIDKQRELNNLRWGGGDISWAQSTTNNISFTTNSSVDFESQLRSLGRNI